MLNRRTIVAGFGVCALVLASACTEVAPTEPAVLQDHTAQLFTGSPPDPAAFSGGLDAIFVRIANELPGFGGLYFDESRTLNVVMAPAAMSVGQVTTALRGWVPTIGLDPSAVRNVRVREGEYNFRELATMRAQADRVVWSLRGVVFTDADEVANRVHIGVEDEAARSAVEQALTMLGLPRDAVIISLAEPEYPMQGLRDRVRPVAGGLQINWPGFICTLGFNVRSPNAPNVHGFVTNSHCTSVRSSMTSTPYWQPTGSVPNPSDPNFIGTEAWDIPFFTDPPCPSPANLCRWSDAAGAQYAPGIDNAFGQIYRPTGIGSLVIDPTTPRFNITEERPRTVVGDSVNKVGRTTGWSSGTSIAACVNVGVAGTTPQQVMLCQDRFNMTPGTQGGDSGSPMFQRIGPNEVRLVGILWGTTTFSPMENIRFENQGPAPWITFPGQTPPPPGPPPAP